MFAIGYIAQLVGQHSGLPNCKICGVIVMVTVNPIVWLRLGYQIVKFRCKGLVERVVFILLWVMSKCRYVMGNHDSGLGNLLFEFLV